MGRPKTDKLKKKTISKVKRINQKRNKKTKPSKVEARIASKQQKESLLPKAKKTLQRKKEKTQKPLKRPANGQVGDDEEESDHGEDMLGMVEEDDLAFLKTAITQRSYDIFKQIRSSGGENEREPRKRQRNKDADYEEGLEKSYVDDIHYGVKRKPMLPIKTSRGLIAREVDYEGDSDEEREKAHAEKETTVDEKDEEVAMEEDEEIEPEFEPIFSEEKEFDPNKPITAAQLLAHREEVLNKRKLHIGLLSSGIIENPEQKMKNFTPLLEMMDEKNPEVKITVKKLATISLLEVFKDILPSYYIRHIDADRIQLKKSTMALRKFEQELLAAYKKYLTKLEMIASCLIHKKGSTRKFSEQEKQLGEVAVQCMAELLVAHSYFNFSANLAYFLVTFLNNASPTVRETAKTAIKKVFKEDKRGNISLELVKRINGLVKRRGHNVYADVLEVLLALRIKDINLDKGKEDDIQQKKLKSRKMKVLTMSRNERKREKKLKEVEKELQETKAEENKQLKLKSLTEVVKMVFLIYFRILKKEPNSKLLSVTLEGLAKYAHCISLDYYHDLVNVLDDLMDSGELGYREQLHIVQTVFTILSGQGENLTIDPCRFYAHLYRNFLKIHAGKSHSDLIILLRAVEAMLIKRRKKVSQQRILAFTKRLATLSLHVLHNGSISCLAHVKNVLQLIKPSDILLDLDLSGGQGLYDPLLEDPEYCNAGSAALWEVALLHRHYHPLVKKFSGFVSAGAPETGFGSLPLDLVKLSAAELFDEFSGSEMAFKPAIPPPKKAVPKQRPSKHYICNALLNDEVKKVMDSPIESGDFYRALKNST